jgi:hypothetical protein
MRIEKITGYTIVQLIEATVIKAGTEWRVTTHGSRGRCDFTNGQWMRIIRIGKKFGNSYDIYMQEIATGKDFTCTCETTQNENTLLIEYQTAQTYVIPILTKTKTQTKSYMSPIINLVKKLALQATDPDEATLRTATLHDQEGNLTANGVEVLLMLAEKTYKAEMVAIAEQIVNSLKK